ncbi:Phosphoribosylpyrophosphate synthetase [Bosea sp. 62]|uniref:Ribose-phosphate pyrophosphokinase n=1 Tax=Hansschlegelia zhihuaiae TaxID=405005 RepID=A0A4Q0MDT8_9HYPH|nr:MULTISPECIES: ribose-phosphate pyrophosphokinase [Hyphomicrobiales]RXF71434.1 ribose-phosphate pyrophosphokinase [Hansschlegelia zhihuaiae]CAD5291369.1 Phosphoribosylpyrophosphate synthetase [Bosea sp. 21B]CAD5292523.1 Phosphoribosylpyrophosphate synthetase [Bosea sp. 46]CAD5300124.1 Phosphoribosylpyrophosphate synthetase [Bosea sp. 7B]VVT57207.1 Phosphoribosylpyrophosphate synthetase [Bosea sp. EC-HK365B]
MAIVPVSKNFPHIIIPLPGNEAFARDLASAGAGEVGAIETRNFPDGETYVRLASDVAGRAVLLVSTLARPDEGFLRLIFLADAARSLGAAEVTLVAPYLAYMRQDRRFQPGEAVTSRSFARLISSSFDRLVTVDPHLHRYPALSALYDIRTLTLHAAPLLADWIAASITKPLVIGPDEESEQWVSAIAARIGAPHAVLRKIRHGDRDVEVALPDLSQWSDLQPVLVDDIASSGNTLIEAARQLPSQGFTRPDVAVVHGIFAGDSYARLAPLCGRIVSTNSVSHASNAIGLARLIADAVAAADTPGPGPIRHRRPPEPIDDVERAGIDSFPASDPPPWTGGVE